tara:strand:- start:5557 stop:5760 length:204 start_codon:yes stop_codon:yes gene_type:complete
VNKEHIDHAVEGMGNDKITMLKIMVYVAHNPEASDEDIAECVGLHLIDYERIMCKAFNCGLVTWEYD